MKRLVLAFVLFFSLFGMGQAQEEWTQGKFTDLVTFTYKYGEVTKYYDISVYSLTLEESGWLKSYFGFIPELNKVTLTVEAFELISDGRIVFDHNWYDHEFCEETGQYYPYPNVITGRFATLKDGILLESIPKNPYTFKKEGYKKPEWEYWINKFYEYMQETLAKGNPI